MAKQNTENRYHNFVTKITDLFNYNLLIFFSFKTHIRDLEPGYGFSKSLEPDTNN